MIYALAVAVLALLSGAPAALADTDLTTLLPAAPSADWIERSPTPTNLEGAFDRQRYGLWAEDSGVSDDALKQYGFVAGYDREWQQKLTEDYLVERVFEFGSAGGAGYWYQDLKLALRTSKYFKREIPALGTADSLGVELVYEDGSHSYVVYFTKGKFMFSIHMQADTNDLAQKTISVSQAAFDLTPASVDVASRSSSKLSAAASWTIGLAVFAGVVLITTVIFFAVRSSSRGRSAVGAYGIQMSPDGAYWWDGIRWRPTATDPPPRPPY